MVKLLRFPLIVPCLLLLTLISCSSRPSEKEAAFLAMVHAKDVNTSIVMKTTPNAENSVDISNQTSYSVSFPKDLGLKLYAYDDNQKAWTEIGDDMEWLNSEDVVIPPKDNNKSSQIAVWYMPNFGNHQPTATIRALITGKIIKNGVESDQEVAAFTDVPFVK